MLTIFKRFSLVAGFAALSVVLVADALVTRRELGVQIEDNGRVIHTRQIRSALEKVESLLEDAESGQRGYLYTGDTKYLAPYELARTQIDPQIDNLARLTSADSSNLQDSVAELRNLAHSKLSELSQTISFYQAGKPQEARAVVLSDFGLSVMEHFRQVASRMDKEEAARDAIRSSNYRESIRITVISIYLSSLVAILGLMLLAYFILHEMGLREKHAHEMREREEWFRVTLTSIGDAVIATNQQGKVLFLNSVAETLTGRKLTEVRGRDIRDVFPIFNEYNGAPTENPVKRVMDAGLTVELANHTVLQHADGHLTPIEDSAAPIRDDKNHLIGVVLVFRDVTKDRKSQEHLRRSEKLAAAARLSATFAHEINNPLEAVGNLIFIAKESPGVPDDVVQTLALADKELERVAHITRQTLGFYRESGDPEPVAVAPLVESILGLYSNKLKAKQITIQSDLGDLPPVMGIAGELRQAISNLISNAVDAVSMNGSIALKAQCIRDNSHSVVNVMIEDDGPGIPAANMERIFEPFFTTKKDVGNGLGLWVTREIIERHGGQVSVATGAGEEHRRGACFVIHLPCHAEPMPNQSQDDSA